MEITIQTKLDATHSDFLDETAKYLSPIKGSLLKDLLAGKESLNDLKKRYLTEYQLMARQFNSLACEVKGLLSSTKTLHQKNISSRQSSILSLKKHIAKLKKRQKALLKQQKSNHEKKEENQEIKKLSFKIHQKNRKLNYLEHKLKKLQAKKAPSICLGGKKLFKKQFHLKENGYENHQEWKHDFQKARTNRIFFLGSKDEKWGNQNCQLLPHNILQVRVVPALESKYSKYYNLEVSFPYKQDLLKEALKKGQAISYRFVRKEKGWYLFATFQKVVEEPKTRKDLGVVGIDLNSDHLALAETDRFGNLINFKRIPLPLHSRTKNQRKATIGDAVKEVLEYAKKVKKPVAIEELDFSKKKSQLEGKSKKYKRMISSFGYNQFKEMIYSRASREDIEVLLVDPKYSSIIGKHKYSKAFGISVHLAAAFVLARRANHYKEHLPKSRPFCLAVHRQKPPMTLWKMFDSAVSNRDFQVEPRNKSSRLCGLF